MNKIIKINYFESIEGCSSERFFPIISKNAEYIENVIKNVLRQDQIIENLNNSLYRLYRDKRNFPYYEDIIIKNESWFIPPLETIEYELIFIKNKNDYEKIHSLFIEELENMNEKELLDRSLSYFKIKNEDNKDIIILNDWSNFSTTIKNIEIVEISNEESKNFRKSIEEIGDLNQILSVDTLIPIYTLLNFK